MSYRLIFLKKKEKKVNIPIFIPTVLLHLNSVVQVAVRWAVVVASLHFAFKPSISSLGAQTARGMRNSLKLSDLHLLWLFSHGGEEGGVTGMMWAGLWQTWASQNRAEAWVTGALKISVKFWGIKEHHPNKSGLKQWYHIMNLYIKTMY